MMPDVSVPGDIDAIIDKSLYREYIISYIRQETNPTDRKIRLYFGDGSGVKPTKEEVGGFIKNQMGLVRSGEKPEWSSGVCQLISMGMDAWQDGKIERAHLISPERVEKLEERNRELKNEVQNLRSELARSDQDGGKVDAAKRVQTIEASILKVLCSDKHLGAKSPNYVQIETISQTTGHDYDTVMHYVRSLSKIEFGGHVEIDRMENNAKAARETAFEEYCDAARIDGMTLDE
ncbi:hypothetical protein BDK61_1424 [Haloarcula quadrata]|uniref:Uncharacterized protein n=1 Tax=Haloarcula quadrata TaxID=182779 RepID=A0A495R469_9EURY|nr:hypothetical protein [Haloarcula quadrata]RKS82127.1 hypothetical protein BDK61_1424 [Haloarcula quadrata]